MALQRGFRGVAVPLAGIASFALASVSVSASAAVCCGEASGLGDRLSSMEIAAFTPRLSIRTRFGSFDGEGDFTPIPSGVTDVRIDASLGALVRVASRVEMGVRAGGALNVRASGEERDIGGGATDVRAHARVTLLPSTAHRYWPGLSAIAGVVVPTGIGASASTSALAADVTGQGDGEVFLGASTDKVFENVFFVRLDGSAGFFLPSVVDGESIQRAPRLSVAFVAGPTFERVALAFGVSHAAEGPSTTAPPDIESRTRTEALVSVVWDFTPGFALIADVSAPLPVSRFGTHETANAVTSLGLRAAVFE
ncbi:MAG: hypothetical protein HOW73_15455 [Polyangiaceae bacterium]|nr:hypothetical protein [Polyangiaceae bacterium]